MQGTSSAADGDKKHMVKKMQKRWMKMKSLLPPFHWRLNKEQQSTRSINESHSSSDEDNESHDEGMLDLPRLNGFIETEIYVPSPYRDTWVIETVEGGENTGTYKYEL